MNPRDMYIVDDEPRGYPGALYVHICAVRHAHILLIVAVMESYPNQETSVYRATTLGNIVRVHL